MEEFNCPGKKMSKRKPAVKLLKKEEKWRLSMIWQEKEMWSS
jgi:hypothetical protein